MTLKKRDITALAFCMLIAAIFLSVCAKSSPLYPINDWEDANAYFSCGKGMLQGSVIYRDLFEHKGPYIYGLHALCALIDFSSFLGVFFAEIAAMGLFLLSVYKLLALWGAKRAVWILLPVITAVLVSSTSFRMGDSAEELCLPLLGWPLYFLFKWLKHKPVQRMSLPKLFCSGIFCGIVLWTKFTMLGFFAAWIGGIVLYHAWHKQLRIALTALGWFLMGIGMATLPWLVYFTVNHALSDWFRVYLYDNIFLYSGTDTVSLVSQLKLMLQTAWDWFVKNPAYTFPMAAGAIWFTLSTRFTALQKLWLWSLMVFLGIGVFIGGKPYVYYGYIFAAFAFLIALPVCRLLDMVLQKPRPALWCAILCTTAALLASYIISPNTKDLLKPKQDTMQYRFAAIMQQVPDATLLNYYFLDSGFYTAAGIAPSVKYFHYTNVPLPEMLTEQNRYITQGVTDFVVTRGRQPETITDQYTLVATQPATEGLWYDTVYLYQRSDLLPSI